MSRRQVYSIALLFYSLFGCLPLCAGEVLTLDASGGRVSLLSQMQWAHDSAGHWSIAEAQQQSFQPLTTPMLGRRNGALWLRVPVYNRSDHELSLVLDTGDAHTERVEFYVVDPQRQLAVQTGVSGISLPYAERTIKSLSLANPLQLAAHQRADIYLRLNSRFNITVNAELYDIATFVNRESNSGTVALLFYGIFIALIIYNSVFAIYVREREYLFFIAFLTSWTLLLSAVDGFIYRVWPYAFFGGYSPEIFYALFGLAFISLSLFTRVYLRLKQFSRPLNWMQHVFIAWGIFIAIGPILIGYENSYRAALLLSMLMLLTDVYAGWIVFRRGQRFALEYTASLVLILMTIILMAIVGGDSSINLARIALFFPALLFSIGTANRISVLKKEAILLQKEAEMANYAAEFKSRFLATMSHEIRTPMNGVLGMVELLKDSAPNHLQRQYLEIIDNSGKALLSVINDILDFSKLESGQITLEKLSINLEAIVDECISIFSAACRGRDINFTVEISPQLPRYFYGDPTRIKQVLINLLGNAFKFTEHGQVTLRVFEQDANEYPEISFAVADTGAGISAEAQIKLFMPFGQADSSITRRYGGTGLGLAISKQLVDVMGGRIEVESELGKGTIFTATLPLLVGEEPDIEEVQAQNVLLKGKRILLVDDYAPFILATENMLRRWGLQVDVATSAGEAIKLLSGHVYDLMLLDLYLPDGNGLQFVDEFRLKNREIAIVTLSSSDRIPHSDDLQRHGISRHILKPFQFSLLRRILIDTFGAKTAAEIHHSAAEKDLHGLRVLVAEDNRTNQVVISSMLKKLGVDFEVVGNGREAVERVRHILFDGSRFDAVLMDCEMPEMDGYTATETIRALEKEMSVQPQSIIGLSAHALEEYRDKALKVGMGNYLIKPIMISVLGEALKNSKSVK